MSRLYVARGEDRVLDHAARTGARGSFVTLSDGVTHYELAGPATGPLVVLIPGMTIPLDYWDGVACELHERSFRTLAYSAYGRGWSDRIEGRYDLALFVRQLTELLDTVAARDSLHVVGTSLGGLIALAYATHDGVAPPRSLTVIGPAGLSTQPRSITRVVSVDPLARALGTLFGHRALAGHLAQNVRSADDAQRLVELVSEPYRFHGSIYALLSTLRDLPLTGQQDLYRRAAQLPIPKLVLWGRHDHITPVELLDTVRELLEPQDCQVFEDCGHMVPFEDPHATAQALGDFFAYITGGAAT